MVKLQKVVVVVEIWNKESKAGDESQEDKLIARIVEHKNIRIVSVSPGTPSSANWEEGGIPASTGNSPFARDNVTVSSFNSSFIKEAINTISDVTCAYRWRIIRDNSSSVSSLEEDTQVETTTKMICQEGFRGSDCKEAVCASGCHPTHGYCEKPGECKCKFGWTGLLSSLLFFVIWEETKNTLPKIRKSRFIFEVIFS
jgi:hypothetical protein